MEANKNNNTKSKLDIILDQVEYGRREVTFDVRGYTREQKTRVVTVATERGLNASSDGSYICVRNLQPISQEVAA